MTYRDFNLDNVMKQNYLDYVAVVPSEKETDKLAYWKNIWDGFYDKIECDNRFCRYEMLKKLKKTANGRAIIGAVVYKADADSGEIDVSGDEYVVPLCQCCVQDSDGIVIELKNRDVASL